ncbi:MAG: HDOD domain-containing protein [Planctomycetota bacterium]
MSTLDELAAGIEDFATIPEVVTRVIRELERPDECNLEEVAELITLDPVLAARITQVSRSALFGGGAADESLEAAIMRIGLKRTYNIVTTVGVLNAVPSLPEPLSLVSFWTLGLGSALTAEQLAFDLGYQDPKEAYLAGLVHLLGEAYLAVQFTPRYRRAIQTAREKGQSYDQGLLNEFEVTHTELCTRLLYHWNFPASVIRAVQYCADPELAEEDHMLPSIIFAADGICRDLLIADSGPDHVKGTWVVELPDDFIERIEGIGHSDISCYLTDRPLFLCEVEDFVKATFQVAAR